MSNKRYRIINTSVSCHCCFVCTVVDTVIDADTVDKNTLWHFNYHAKKHGFGFTVLCECLDEADAERICEALNAAV